MARPKKTKYEKLREQFPTNEALAQEFDSEATKLEALAKGYREAAKALRGIPNE